MAEELINRIAFKHETPYKDAFLRIGNVNAVSNSRFDWNDMKFTSMRACITKMADLRPQLIQQILAAGASLGEASEDDDKDKGEDKGEGEDKDKDTGEDEDEGTLLKRKAPLQENGAS